jgi:branched-chain amino acid transport system ATP-binding protein
MTAPAIEIKDVQKSFGNISIIRDLNLSVAQGERHALIGPNGAGKSTTFNLISGYIRPTSGTVTLRGEVISGCHRIRSTAAACRAASRSPMCSPT